MLYLQEKYVAQKARKMLDFFARIAYNVIEVTIPKGRMDIYG